MFVGACEVELFIGASASLKDKRFVLRSIKDKVRHKFNVSIAEVSFQDQWQRAGLGLAAVANEQHVIREQFDEILRLIESADGAEITKRTITIY